MKHELGCNTLEVQELIDELLCVRDYIEDASRGRLLYRGKADISEMAGDDLCRIDSLLNRLKSKFPDLQT
jgi:hypothetical protein